MWGADHIHAQDHIAIATTVRAAAELALRMGKIEEAIVNAKRSEDEFSRLNEPQVRLRINFM